MLSNNLFRSSALCVALVFVGLAGSRPGVAQDKPRFNFGGGTGGAGFTVPVQEAGTDLNMGWNFDVRGGLNMGRISMPTWTSTTTTSD